MVVSIARKSKRKVEVLLSGGGIPMHFLIEFVGKDLKACEQRASVLHKQSPYRDAQCFYGVCQLLFELAVTCNGTFSGNACTLLDNGAIIFNFSFDPENCVQFVELVCEKRVAGAFWAF